MLTSLLECKGCSTSCCIFCTPPLHFTKCSVFGFQDRHVMWCCVGGRLLLLWLLLCGIDEHFSASKSELFMSGKSDEEQRHKKKDGRRSKQPSRSEGVGFHGPRQHGPEYQMPSGMGYGGGNYGGISYDTMDLTPRPKL
jgi:hypothetical protein